MILTSQDRPHIPGGARSTRSLGRHRILLVEDDGTLRFIFERTLAAHYEVVAVQHGSEALALLRGGETYDLILSDLMMPGMTGAELHRALEHQRPEQARCMVFLTGGATTDEGAKFLQRHTWLKKPITPSSLLSVVNSWLPLHKG